MRLEAALVSDILYLFGQENCIFYQGILKSFAYGNHVATLKVDRSHRKFSGGKQIGLHKKR